MPEVCEKTPTEEFCEAGEGLIAVLKADITTIKDCGKSGQLLYDRRAANYLLKEIAKLTRLISNADKP